MARTVSIGAQGFEEIRTQGYFYVDKTSFVRDWWKRGDAVTLVCRPRRFGKTLNLDTVRCFLSTEFAGRGEELFGGLDVWRDPAMRALQGTVPVVSLSFAAIKERDRDLAVAEMKRVLRVAVDSHRYLRDSAAVGAGDRAFLDRVSDDMDDGVAASCLNRLCAMLKAHWGVRPVVLLDEYDAPMQEAWLGDYWDEAVAFQRSLFNATFKTNPALGRGLMTGVTRVSRESIFSDLNNLDVVTIFTAKYGTSFGFTEDEVFSAMGEFGLADRDGVRLWFDGFTFGGVGHLYNPWSVTNYLDKGELLPYWANTSSNALASMLVRTGDATIKGDFAELLQGHSLHREVDDEVVFSSLAGSDHSVWSMLLASGYLKADRVEVIDGRHVCDLSLTNREVLVTFERMVEGWFDAAESSYNGFVQALLAGDAEAMEAYLSDVALACMSSFDSGMGPSVSRPERFWHGLVLGLLVELRGRYEVALNRESGYGRCDVLLTPLVPGDPGVVLEFKAANARRGETLEEAVRAARAQIEERAYTAALAGRGVAPGLVRTYGIAFLGKEVLVG